MKSTSRGMLASLMAMASGLGTSVISTKDVADEKSKLIGDIKARTIEVAPKRKPKKKSDARTVFVRDLQFWNSAAGKAMREWNIAVDRKKLAKQQAKIDVAGEGDVGGAAYHRALDRMSILRRHASLY